MKSIKKWFDDYMNSKAEWNPVLFFIVVIFANIFYWAFAMVFAILCMAAVFLIPLQIIVSLFK